MRLSIAMAAAAMLAACGSGGEQQRRGETAALGPGLYRFADNGGMCVGTGEEAAFVIYGEGGANCMAQGRIEAGAEGGLAFVPRGDDQCRIPIEDRGQSIVLGEGGESCSYYCGGEARYAGRELVKAWDEEPDLRDAAGEAIC